MEWLTNVHRTEIRQGWVLSKVIGKPKASEEYTVEELEAFGMVGVYKKGGIMKPNCYKCRHRGGTPGDAHSRCGHPKALGAFNDPLANIMAIFASVGRTTPMQAETPLHVVGDPHGIRHGWFNWPWNFDPVWLEKCDGFEEEKDATN